MTSPPYALAYSVLMSKVIKKGGVGLTKLRALRGEKGMSVIDTAYATRVHPSQLASIERGKLAASANAKKALCEFYGVLESDLFDSNGLAA